MTTKKLASKKTRANTRSPRDVAIYLERFGYFHPAMNPVYRKLKIKPPSKFLKNIKSFGDISGAIRAYQYNMGIPATGRLDPGTAAILQQPRCGNPDFPNRGTLEGIRWAKGDLRYHINNSVPSVTPTDFRNAVYEAFQYWQTTGISLRFAESNPPDIILRSLSGHLEDQSVSDGPGNILGVTFYANTPVLVDFDAAENWVISPRRDIDFVNVATHEFGHAIGLGHSPDSNAIMYAYYQYGRSRGLGQDDVATIRALYPSYWGVRWEDMHAWTTNLAVAANGVVWHVARGDEIRRWNESTHGWDSAIGGAAVCIAAAPDGHPWHIGHGDTGGDNNIYEWVNGVWVGRAGWAYDLAVGANGAVYHVGRGGTLHRYVGGNIWNQVSGAAVNVLGPPWGHAIAVDSTGGCWHIGGGQDIYRPVNGVWQGTGAFAYAIGAGPNGEMMHVGRGNRIFVWEGYWREAWSDGWATAVSIGPGGQCIHVGHDNGIWRRAMK
jgi:hypothetical protein